jgi:AraC family transcriptional regulator of adaptative response/methylated-DNA-[protein]-cysteine methyltransferase
MCVGEAESVASAFGSLSSSFACARASDGTSSSANAAARNHILRITTLYDLELVTMEITYTTGDCLLGKFLVATTRKGICMIAIGKSDAELERRLFDSFPDADPKRNDRSLAATRRIVERRISGKDLDKKLPLDLHGTPFQVAVWKEMLRIPAGRTKSYAEVARAIGRPSAYRAVAQACGANPVPVIVPCHRVVASNGLGGYTGGIDRKIHLLGVEGVAAG